MITSTAIKSSNNKQAAVALAFSLILLSGSAVFAQGMDNSFSQDSLLPPEVMPMTPAAANAMAQSAGNTSSMSTGQAPGLAQSQIQGQMYSMQSAKDARKAAFAQLMGTNGQMPTSFGGQQLPAMSNSGVFNPAQNPAIAGNPQLAQSAFIPQNAPSAMSQPQSQTLTGGVQNQQGYQDTRRGGFSNNFSATSSLGSHLLFGNMMTNPMSLLGLGMYGLAATGFGTRNGFRL